MQVRIAWRARTSDDGDFVPPARSRYGTSGVSARSIRVKMARSTNDMRFPIDITHAKSSAAKRYRGG
jgi:hypothetical protein